MAKKGSLRLPSPLILERPMDLGKSKLLGSMQREIGITQELAGHNDQIGLTGSQYIFRLRRFRDHPYRRRHHTGGPDTRRNIYLISWSYRDLHIRYQPAR